MSSTAKLDYVTGLGAHHVLAHDGVDWVDGTCRYDLILDTAGNPSSAGCAVRSPPRGRPCSSAVSTPATSPG